MIVTLLGTGSPLPSAERAGPATLVQAGGCNLLFDCGRGVAMRLAAAGIPAPLFLTSVLLTHLHSDHVTDFNDLVTTQWVVPPVRLPLRVVGPPGTQAFADRTVDMMRVDVGYRLAHHDDLELGPAVEVQEALDGEVHDERLEQAGLRLFAAPTDHRPVAPTVGYRVEHDGRVVVIAGDTVPCEGLDRLVQGADVYVQTVIRHDLIQAIGVPRLLDVCDYHSTVEQAAQTAARGGVGTLVLTHMVPEPAPGTEEEWVELARGHFDGEVLLASDLDRVEV